MSSPSSGPFLSTGSSTSPSETAATSSPSPTQSSDPTANATLYLYTFLATLVLLLAVSSAIVIRSLILRRRHQRLVEEAIRTGTWLPSHYNSTSRRRRDLGEKPKLWDTWLNLNHDDGETEESEKRNWADIMPVYAAYVNPPVSSFQGSITGSTETPVNPSSRRPAQFMRNFTRKRSPSAQPATAMAGQPSSAPPSSPKCTPPAVRVAVLIAMPNPSPKRHDDADESEPPVVEIGVVEVNAKDEETES